MSFQESLKILGLESYESRIVNSNSHGELFNIADYVWLADSAKKVNDPMYVEFLKIVIKCCIEFCEKNWSRPESMWQHMPRLIDETIKAMK